MRYSDYEQRQMDIASGRELDRRAERRARATQKSLADRLRDVGCDRPAFEPAHADCVCRLTHAAADMLDELRGELQRSTEQLNAFVQQSTDPGTEALSSLFEARRILSRCVEAGSVT